MNGFTNNGWNDAEKIAIELEAMGYPWAVPEKGTIIIVAAVLQRLVAGLAPGDLNEQGYECLCVASGIVEAAEKDGLISLEAEEW